MWILKHFWPPLSRRLLRQNPHATAEDLQAAQAAVLRFKATPQPYALCQALFEQSHSEFVQFEAVSLARDALLREWDSVPTTFRNGVRQSLLRFVLQHHARYVKTGTACFLAVDAVLMQLRI